MSATLAFALGAMLLFGVGDLVYKRGAAAGALPHHFLMVQSWVFSVCVTLYALATGSLHFVAGSLWGGVAGFFVLVGFYNFAHSLRLGSISINAPVFRLSFVLTAGLAIAILGEPLTPFKVGGVALALAAAWLLLGAPPPGAAGEHRETRAALLRVIVATLFVGTGNFVYMLGLRSGATPGSIIVTQAAFVVTMATSFSGFVDRGIRPGSATLRYAPIAAVVLALGFAFMVEGMARGQASIVVPIAQMGFVATALLGFAFLGEPFTRRKGIGIVTAVAALASLAHG